ncbi:hypothetical protein E0Z10_g8880 [Xylaria hypoxylon]|uniref:Uncharacterized protein n=1 Tax=Xylaria hypoxylon TaxID=37992 RepID=A0A4Z0Y7W9_9PEZI|nr:hypothetical protein E0Z10_g8880 [Xylaria hypoxylon]
MATLQYASCNPTRACEDEMIKSMEISKPKPEWEPRNNRFNRIEIWRNEVAASPISCVCSAPTMQAKGAGVAGSLYRSMTKFGIYNPLTNEEEDALCPHRKECSGNSHSRERIISNCNVCASPMNGVTYKLLGGGSGLVRARASSSQSLSSASIRCLEEGGQMKQERGRSLLKRVSQAFRRTKGLDPRLRSIEPTGTREKTDANAPGASISSTASPRKEVPRRKNGTEMYYRLRLEGTADDDQEDESIGAVSDDDRKKLVIGIDESAARLRRAQRLFNKDT